METIADGKQFLRNGWQQGVNCPCCGQLVKLYDRKLNSGMAIFLLGLYGSTFEGNFEHASTVLVGTKSLDYSVLRHWRLIEEDNRLVAGKRKSGFWRVSERGRKFVEAKITVPSHVKLFNNKLVGFSEDRISITQALGKNFDYNEVMRDYELPFPSQLKWLRQEAIL